MLIQGPLPANPIPSSGDSLNLRPFQRVNAEVIQVNGTQAILSIEGHHIVARLADADQAADLLAQRTARFIVSELSGQSITLKLVTVGSSSQPVVGTVVAGRDLAARLLEQLNLPVNGATLVFARAAINQGLAVNGALLDELQVFFASQELPGMEEVELATAIKAAGLPLTAESLQLAARSRTELAIALSTLLEHLRFRAETGTIPPGLLEAFRSARQGLLESIIHWQASPSRISEQVRAAIELLGRSLEKGLLEVNKGNPTGLVEIAKLAGMLRQAGENSLAEGVTKFLEDARAVQFFNLRPDPLPGRGSWVEIPLALSAHSAAGEQRLVPARLRITRDNRLGGGQINPTYTRMVVQVEARAGEMIEVDLAVAGKQIATEVTVPAVEWCQSAIEQLDSLEQALRGLGYQVKNSEVEIGATHLGDSNLMRRNHLRRFTSVDIEA